MKKCISDKYTYSYIYIYVLCISIYYLVLEGYKLLYLNRQRVLHFSSLRDLKMYEDYIYSMHNNNIDIYTYIYFRLGSDWSIVIAFKFLLYSMYSCITIKACICIFIMYVFCILKTVLKFFACLSTIMLYFALQYI